MHGRNVLAADYKPRDAVFAARDRCDETVERLRSVRTERWLYIRNFHPERPHLQPNAYKDAKPIVIRLRELHAAGKLDPLSERLLFAPRRPAEELYDWKKDRSQITNLAGDPAFAEPLAEMRGRLETWMRETRDLGPERDAMYDSDMTVYLRDAGKSPERKQTIERNIALMKRWGAEGK
jgi:hypothetical protein